MKKGKWENWINLFAGAWVFFVPWSIIRNIETTGTNAVMWNFWIVGAVVITSSALALIKIKVWEEWVNLAAGVWLLVSPWMLSFSHNSALLSSAIVMGFVISAAASVAIPVARQLQTKVY